jgi:hypothetical protein
MVSDERRRNYDERKQARAEAFALFPEEKNAVEIVSRKTAAKWPSICRDDITQSLLLWCYSHQPQILRFRASARPLPMLYLSLKRLAIKLAIRESEAVQGETICECNELD